MAAQPLRWGFMGAGHIAQKALGPAVHASDNGLLQAVAAQDKARALNLEPRGKVYDAYEHLLDDDEVDAVYIALTNDMHVPLSIAALKAGKHVLSEKPLAMSADEIRQLIEVANTSDRLMVEASWNRWHPRTRRLQDLVETESIGEITDISAGFVYQGAKPENYRLIPEKGGGAIYDLGPYPIAALLWLTDFAQPEDLQTEITLGPTGVDIDAVVKCRLGSVTGQADVSMNRANDQWLRVIGTDGSVEMIGDQAFTSWHSSSELKVEVNGDTQIEDFPAVDPYRLMVESFAKRALGGEAWLLPIEESLAFASFFDQIFANRR